MQNMVLEDKITVFEALAMSKTVYLVLIINILASTKKLYKHKSNFFGKTKIQKWNKLHNVKATIIVAKHVVQQQNLSAYTARRLRNCLMKSLIVGKL